MGITVNNHAIRMSWFDELESNDKWNQGSALGCVIYLRSFFSFPI